MIVEGYVEREIELFYVNGKMITSTFENMITKDFFYFYSERNYW